MREIDYKTLKVGDDAITRDGRKGRVICVDATGKYRIVCLIDDGDGEVPYSYFIEGAYSTAESDHDIFLPPKKEYVNIYSSHSGMVGRYNITSVHYGSKEEAERNAKSFRDYKFHQTIEVEL